MSMQAASARSSAVSRALARDRLGVPAVLAFILAGVAPLTVAAGLIPTAYAVTGLTGIPAAFLVIAVVLAVFATGYMAMSRHIVNAGAFYAFIAQGLGRAAGVAAALIALAAYSCLQIALYGMLGPAAAGQAAAHLGVHAAWWAWALGAWAVVTVLGLLRVDITGRVLGTLTAVEIAVIVAETAAGLAHPAGGHLSFATLRPSALTSSGSGAAGVLAVIAVLGFSGFEQAPVLGEEARHPRRTIPVTTYTALGLIGVVYAGSAWAMAAHAGGAHVVAAAVAQGPALMFGLGGSVLAQAAQWLFLTSLFAAALAFHNAVWRYAFALGREGVLPGPLGRTGSNNIPKAASLAQSVTGLTVIGAFALAGWSPMTGLFFGGGTTGGFGILLLLALTSVAVIAFFARDPRGESAWSRLIAPALAAVVLTVLAVLAVLHYGTLLGVPPGAAAAWALPASYAVLAAAGLAWGLVIKIRRHRARRTRHPRAGRPGDLEGTAMTARHQPAASGPGCAVVRAHDADIGVLSQVIADAFLNLAPCRWLIDDLAARREVLPGYFRIYVEHAMAGGLADTTPGRDAAALWIPTGSQLPSPPNGYDERLAQVTGRWAGRFAAFDRELHAHHLTGAEHHHLAILAVRPDRQGQGTGTALLDAHHAILDAEGIVAYLEASDERTRGIYLRHGYADYGKPITLASGPLMYPMVRHPRTTGHHPGPGREGQGHD